MIVAAVRRPQLLVGAPGAFVDSLPGSIGVLWWSVAHIAGISPSTRRPVAPAGLAGRTCRVPARPPSTERGGFSWQAADRLPRRRRWRTRAVRRRPHRRRRRSVTWTPTGPRIIGTLRTGDRLRRPCADTALGTKQETPGREFRRVSHSGVDDQTGDAVGTARLRQQSPNMPRLIRRTS